MTRIALVAALAATLVVPAAALHAQALPPPPAKPAGSAPTAGPDVPPAVHALPAAAVTVREVEPNNTRATATPVALGDVVAGRIDPAYDVDYYVFVAEGGTVVEVDVDAASLGSPLDSYIALFDSLGRVLAVNDDAGGLDSRIELALSRSGRYWIAVQDYRGSGSPNHHYQILLSALAPGPGDPARRLASGFTNPYAIAVDGEGLLYVADPGAGRISTVSGDGTVQPLVQGIRALALAVDGFGSLLAADAEGLLYRISPDGEMEIFASALGPPAAVAAGPDGDLWVATGTMGSTHRLFRLDPEGRVRSSTTLPAYARPFAMAFSPAGDLYFTNAGTGVFRFREGRLVRWLEVPGDAAGLGFDAHGNLYVTDPPRGRVDLYGPDGSRLAYPLARSVPFPIGLAFGREPDGSMGRRLFVTSWAPGSGGSIVVLAEAGVLAPGFPQGARLLRVTADPFPRGTVGHGYRHVPDPGGGAGPSTWSLLAGALPPGLALDPATGTVEGVPERPGEFAFRLRLVGPVGFGDADGRIVVGEPAVRVGAAADALLGVGGLLGPGDERYLDLMGNRNGRYDVGDFRAHVIRQGLLAALVPSSP